MNRVYYKNLFFLEVR